MHAGLPPKPAGNKKQAGQMHHRTPTPLTPHYRSACAFLFEHFEKVGWVNIGDESPLHRIALSDYPPPISERDAFKNKFKPRVREFIDKGDLQIEKDMALADWAAFASTEVADGAACN